MSRRIHLVGLFACLVAGTVVPSEAIAQPVFQFQGPQTFPHVGSSRALASGDFNGDGVVDLLSLGTFANVLHIGTGVDLELTAELPSLGQPAAFAVVDLDGDGDDDAVTVYPTQDTVVVTLGDPTVGLIAGGQLTASGDPRGVAAGDIDGDGDVDLAVTRFLLGRVSLYLNDGSGSFTVGPTIDALAGPRGVALADVSGDGVADLVVSEYTLNGFSVFTNDGTGSFVYDDTYPIGNQVDRIVIDDFTQNGRLDVLAVGLEISLAEGLPGGEFAFPYVAYDQLGDVIVTDFDADTDPDLVFFRPSQGVWLLSNDGAGGFNPVDQEAFDSVFGVATGDFNGDAAIDLVVSYSSSAFTVVPGTGTGQFERPISVGDGSFNIASTLLADVTDDALPDLVLFRSGQGIDVYPSTGLLGYGPAMTFSGSGSEASVSADMSGDGLPDFVYAGSGVLRLRLRQPGGGLGPELTCTSAPWDLDVFYEDFNGDGIRDLMSLDSVRLSVYDFGDFESAFCLPATFQPSAQAWDDAALGDTDLDGALDLIDVRFSSLNLYRRTAGFTFALVQTIPLPSSYGEELEVGDFNGDGRADVALSDHDDELTIFLADAAGLLVATPVQDIPVDDSFFVADFDGDGVDDLVVPRFGTLQFYRNDGSGVMIPDAQIPGETDAFDRSSIGDADLDGDLDLLVVDSGGATARVILNETNPGTDCNGSGVSDVLEIASGLAADCNGNWIPDSCDVALVDCNGNGIPDECDIADQTSLDGDGDGVPDECESFLRGDTNSDGAFNLLDVVALLFYLYQGSVPSCVPAFDVDDSAQIDVVDAFYLIEFLFIGGPPPPEPFSSCGPQTGSLPPCSVSSCP